MVAYMQFKDRKKLRRVNDCKKKNTKKVWINKFENIQFSSTDKLINKFVYYCDIFLYKRIRYTKI